MTHYIKIAPDYMRAINESRKTFEIRYNDRGYKVGDVLILREWDREYTGKQLQAVVTYVLDDQQFLREGYVALSIIIIYHKKPNIFLKKLLHLLP